MELKEWAGLSQVEKDKLASKFGLTRSGVNNESMKDEELLKIPEFKEEVVEVKKETKKNVKVKATTKKLGVKAPTKSSDRKGIVSKPKSRKSK